MPNCTVYFTRVEKRGGGAYIWNASRTCKYGALLLRYGNMKLTIPRESLHLKMPRFPEQNTLPMYMNKCLPCFF